MNVTHVQISQHQLHRHTGQSCSCMHKLTGQVDVLSLLWLQELMVRMRCPDIPTAAKADHEPFPNSAGKFVAYHLNCSKCKGILQLQHQRHVSCNATVMALL